MQPRQIQKMSKYGKESAARKTNLLKSVNARGGVLRDMGWTGKVGNHVLIVFKFFLPSNLDILAKITIT